MLFSVNVQIALCFLLIWIRYRACPGLCCWFGKWGGQITCWQGNCLHYGNLGTLTHQPKHSSHILYCLVSYKSWSFLSYDVWLTLPTLGKERSIWFWGKVHVFPTVNSIEFWKLIPCRRNRDAMPDTLKFSQRKFILGVYHPSNIIMELKEGRKTVGEGAIESRKYPH